MPEGVSYFNILFVKCGPIGWALWLLSVVTLAVIIRQFVAIRRATLISRSLAERARELLSRQQHEHAQHLAAGEMGLFARMLAAALSRSARGYGAMERAMEEAGGQEAARLLRQVEWLNLIGNVSPMMGLLGTVWGMILAFFTIMQQGGIPHPGALAGAIGTALVTTLEGLTIAIPALAAYATLRNRIDMLSNEALILCQEMISLAKPPRPRGATRPSQKGTYAPAGREAVKAASR